MIYNNYIIKQICFVTGNKSKVLHAKVALEEFSIDVTSQKLEMIEPREEEPEMVAIEKAIQAFEQIKMPLIVEDSGIFITALNGFPKTFVHFVESTIGIKNILKMMEGIKDRSVEFRQSLAYIGPNMDKPIVFSYIDGGYRLADKIWEEKYESLFGEFDKILIPQNETKPLCTFSKEWRAKRDTESNKGNIHYHQLAHWLSSRG